jgi:uncharacterized protein YbjT (DUF2867 family)
VIDVAIAGGHGKVARRLTRRLVARGDRVRGLIRNPEHADDLREDGAEPVVIDIETAAFNDLAGAIAGADAVVFAAGAGPGSGPERKLTIDRDAAIRLIHAAQDAAVERYLMISTIGAESPPDGDDDWSVYLRAKAAADRELIESDRAWTIVRPVYMNDEDGAGTVHLDPERIDGEVSRDDVADVLAAALYEPRTARRLFYVGPGDEPIDQALSALLGSLRER